MEGCRSEEIMKVMARVGQLNRIKMVCQQEEEEQEDEEEEEEDEEEEEEEEEEVDEEEESRLVSVQGERQFFLFII